MAKIKVTQDHIKRGKRGKSSSCPVALAVRDYMKGYKGGTITVDGAGVWIGPHSFTCPRSVGRFVSDFDAGREVKPFTFVLRST